MSKTPSETEVRETLQTILASEGFRRSRRLRGLLQYLVEETLAGRGDKIKATSIAIDVFGRDENFDQQSDPIVRVEAGRLRQRLNEFYLQEDTGASVLIEIPKGAYLPQFAARRQIQSAAAIPDRQQDHRRTWQAFGLGVAVALAGFWLYSLVQTDQHSPTQDITASDKPYIVVKPVAVTTGNEETERLAAGLAEALITTLSKISGLSVMAHASVIEAKQQGASIGITEFRSRFGVSHLLRGALERDGDRVILNMQLIDARTAKTLWAERISRPLNALIELEEELALTIASELAVQLQPGERDRLSQYHSASSDAWLLYRQGLITIMPPRDLVRVQAARKLFDRATQVDPKFAGGHAGHSFAHSTRVLFMNTTDPDWELGNAKAMASRAISLDPDFGAGYAMLAFAQILADEQSQAQSNALKAVSIQPGDAFARFIVGMSLIISKDPAQSISHLQEALRLDPLESRMPYLNVLGIAYYAAGDYSNALSTIRRNFDRGGPRGPHVDIFIAAALAQLEETEEAADLITSLNTNYGEFPSRKWLNRWLVDEQQLAETIGLLQALGLKL